MKKRELLQKIDPELMEKLYGFCYARTNDSYEAQDLCQDILYALLRAAAGEGDITNAYAFIWRTARNVYADFSEKRRRHTKSFSGEDPAEIFPFIAAEEEPEDESDGLLKAIFRQIANLTRAYREVMIAFYLDGKSTAQIAQEQGVSETAVRQRLFAARRKVKNEVDKMKEMQNKPISLSNIDYVIWGTGSPGWGDPRNGFCRQFSRHVLWLCFKKPSTAAEIAEELNVPTVYVEEELTLLTQGENGKYGLLRKLENGRYGVNFVLFDKNAIEEAHRLYTDQLPKICDTIAAFIEEHKTEYLAFPYLNKQVDINLILWQQVVHLSRILHHAVEAVLAKDHFADAEKPNRPFSVFGYVDNGKHYGGGWDGINAENVCGFSWIHMDNIYITRIRRHFSCGHNIGDDPQIQLALRAINGLDAASLNKKEKEHAARAIEQGYLYRDGDTLYTKILVHDSADDNRLFAVTKQLSGGAFEQEAAEIAEKLAELIRKNIPGYLHGEWRFANDLANMPVIDALVEALIEKGLLVPPENGLGAEGCWMCVRK